MEGFKKEKHPTEGKGENDEVEWITVNGTHIPIKDGETAQKVIEKKFNNGSDTIKNSSTSEFFVEKIDRKDKNMLKSKVTEIMNRLVEDNKEHNVVIDKEGNIFERIGGEDYVEGMDLNLKDSINIHNHLDDVSFGENDFNYFRNYIGADFINVTPNYIHKVKVIKEIDKPYNYFYRNGLNFNEQNWKNQQHNIMEFIKSEGYIKYERLARNSRM